MARSKLYSADPHTEADFEDVAVPEYKTAPVDKGNEFGGETSFAVTCEIGRVVISEPGTGDHPVMVAFRMIFEYDNPGTFRFPDGFGDNITVIVPDRPND